MEKRNRIISIIALIAIFLALALLIARGRDESYEETRGTFMPGDSAVMGLESPQGGIFPNNGNTTNTGAKSQDTQKLPTGTLTVTSPGPSETLTPGARYIIRWESSGLETVGIVLLKDGKEFSQVSDVAIDATKGEYSWQVPDLGDFAGEGFAIGIYSTDESISDASEGTFTIKKE